MTSPPHRNSAAEQAHAPEDDAGPSAHDARTPAGDVLSAAREAAARDAAARDAAARDYDAQEHDAGATQQRFIGRVIDDRYRIDQALAEGGMGAVFIAEHLKLHKTVALKVILPEFVGNDEIAARFAREAMASAQIDHPNVASALDYGALPEGGAYLVMQWVQGRSLQEWVDERGPIPWQMACDIGSQVADALAAAHAKGIVHRDLKPDNILIEDRDGGPLVKVLDFGIARLAQEPAAPARAPRTSLTQVGTVMGTIGYMAPEQAMGEAVDPRADLYALGIIMWEQIAGRQLFTGESLSAVVTEQLTGPLPKLRAATGNAKIPARLDTLVRSLLAKSAGERPEHAAAVRDELRAIRATADDQTGSSPTELLTQLASSTWTGAFATARTELSHTLTAARERISPALGWTLVFCGVLTVSIGLAISAWMLPNAPVVLEKDNQPKAPRALSQTSPEQAEPPKSNRPTIAATPKEPVRVAPKPPLDVRRHTRMMLTARRSSARKNAARRLLAHRPRSQVPAYALAVARLELGRGCRKKQNAIAAIARAGNRAALPALRRIDRTPRRGCGLLKLKDCYACLRGDVAEAIGALKK